MDEMVGEELDVIQVDGSDNTIQVEYLDNYYWIPVEATTESRPYTLIVNEVPVKISIPFEIHEMLILGPCKITLSPNDYTV